MPERIVLALLHEGDPTLRALDRALADCRELGGSVAIAVIHDPAAEEALSAQLTCQSFLGQRQTAAVASVAGLSLDQKQEALLEEARARLAQPDCPPAAIYTRRGPLGDELPALARELQPAKVYVPALAQGTWDRLLHGDATQALARALAFPVVVVMK